jgi:hypothetical protein
MRVRLQAPEDRIAADLSCGSDRDVLPELTGLVREERFRERTGSSCGRRAH